MSKVAKQIIVILVLLLIISVVLALSTLSQKTELEQTSARLTSEVSQYQNKISEVNAEIKAITSEKDDLERQMDEAVAAKSRAEEQMARLNSRIQELSGRIEDMQGRSESMISERDEWKERYREIQKERDDAIEKIREQEARLAAQPVFTPPATVAKETTSDKEEEEYWAEVLKEKAELSLRVSDLQKELSDSSMEIEELKKKNSDLELEISYIQSEKNEILQKMTRTEQAINTLSIELVREKNHKKTTVERVDHLKEENLMLRAQIKELAAMKVILEKSVAKIQEEKEMIQQKLVETETIIKSRINEVENIRRSIDDRMMQPAQEIMLPPIVVSSSAHAAQSISSQQAVGSTGSYGAIININRDNNFVIIDLGETAGIYADQVFNVYRGTDYIGEVKVIQVRKDISAADITKQSVPIQIGDIVK